jgi:DNA anti-recombination protein RmuC
MTQPRPMTRLELIRLIGDVITEVDVLSSTFEPGSKNRKRLDNFRDDLDTSQRKLVRNLIRDNTEEFKELTGSLKEVNGELRQTIDDVDELATTLETLAKFIGVVQKIVELIPL